MTPASRHRRHIRRRQVGAWCDEFLLIGVVFLLIFGPFAFGSVHPQAYGVLEIVAGLLVLIWLAKLRFAESPKGGLPVAPKTIWIPLGGFLAVVLLQVVPLPPSVIGVLSPGTYDLYATTLPGWPSAAPYESTVRDVLAHDDVGVQPADLNRPVSLPGVDEVAQASMDSFIPDAWGRLPGEPLLDRVDRQQLERWVDGGRSSFASWRTLSVEPGRTFAEWLKILAYLAVFAVVTFYPTDGTRRAESSFQRRILRAVVFAAVAVAAVGLLQRLSWNGKILWFFVPWDWGAPKLDMPQTSGPFVSRNNFGGYLGMTLPLVLVPALVSSRLDLRRRPGWTRVVYGVGAAVVGTALLFSLSRGAWIASGVSLVILFVGLLRSVPRDKRAPVLRTRTGRSAIAGVVVIALLALILVPSGGSELGSDIDRRLQQSVSSTASWDARVSGWRDSLPMIAEFPMFGVGLATWGELFPKYDQAFYFGTQFRRAHNDYLQVVAEAGIFGAGLLLAAVIAAGIRLRRATPERSHRSLAVSLAIGAGLVALLLHELVDFDLQMPGIAVTAMVLLGIGLRGSWKREMRSPARRLWVPVGAVAAVGFLAAVLTQPTTTASTPIGLAGALQRIEESPTRSSAHLALGVELAELSPALARPALDAAVVLNPSSPGPRDARVVVAAQMGDRDLALREIEESMYRAPSTTLHPLLAARAATWLPPESREAAERGFGRAVEGAGFRAAIALASFRSSVREHRAAASAWERAAALAPTATSAVLLERAGWELARVGDLDEAEAVLRRAIDVAPKETGPRTVLIGQVLGRRGDIGAARREVEAGQDAGADSYELRLALGDAARFAEEFELERAVLLEATRRRPGDVRAHYRLGMSWYRDKHWAKAAQSLEDATRAEGDYAPAWFYLALASERAYEFHAAARAFARAVDAAPENVHYREQRERFAARLEAG